MQRLLTSISRGLPVWVLLGAVLAYLRPDAFQWTAWVIFDQKFFAWMFAITMFAVGTVVELRHFNAVIRSPRSVALGILTQFMVMPLCAWLVARVAGFSDALTLGFILVGCAPGAMTSNVLTYLARGDTAFSVTLTTIASLLAVVVTPLLVELLAGEKLGMTPAKFWASLWTIAWTVAIPVLLGLLLRVVVPIGRKLYAAASPAIASVAIVIICCHVIQSNSTRLAELHAGVMLAVIVINAVGFAAGYLLAVVYRFPPERRITLCIEIGMQNAGMGVVLASTTFADRPEVAVPSALFTIWCVLTGAGLIEVLKRSKRQPSPQ